MIHLESDWQVDQQNPITKIILFANAILRAWKITIATLNLRADILYKPSTLFRVI